MSYDALLAELARLRKAAGPLGINTSQGTTLAAPAHEMVACAEALVKCVAEFEGEHPSPCPAEPDCWLDNAHARLTALAAAMGVEAQP